MWTTRRPVEFLEEGTLNVEAGKAAVAEQDEAARAGRALPSIVSGTGVPRTRRIRAGIERGLLRAREMFASIEPGGVRWADGTFQEADAIIWATGFRPELRHLAALGLREKEGGVIVANGASEREPRVFFAGYGPQASTIGANRAGRSIARQAIATLSGLERERWASAGARSTAPLAGPPADLDSAPERPDPVEPVVVEREPLASDLVVPDFSGSILIEPASALRRETFAAAPVVPDVLFNPAPDWFVESDSPRHRASRH